MTMNEQSRRDFSKLMGLGGVVFASGLAGCTPAAAGKDGKTGARDFFFLQLSDTHWGFQGPPNPEAERHAAAHRGRDQRPRRQADFVVFTGDLTHTTDDPKERRRRMAEFKSIVSGLGRARGALHPRRARRFGRSRRGLPRALRRHALQLRPQGIHFVALDNVSDPAGALGDEQIAWLRRDLARPPRAPRPWWCSRTGRSSTSSPLGLDHDGRAGRDRRPLGARERDGLLRSHPPGAPPHHRAHRAPRGALADLPAARAGLGAQARAAAVGPGEPDPRDRLPAGRPRRRGLLPAHRGGRAGRTGDGSARPRHGRWWWMVNGVEPY